VNTNKPPLTEEALCSLCNKQPAVPGQAHCADCRRAYMRGLRVRQKEITKISKADAHQRLREILEIAMPTSFVLMGGWRTRWQ